MGSDTIGPIQNPIILTNNDGTQTLISSTNPTQDLTSPGSIEKILKDVTNIEYLDNVTGIVVDKPIDKPGDTPVDKGGIPPSKIISVKVINNSISKGTTNYTINGQKVEEGSTTQFDFNKLNDTTIIYPNYDTNKFTVLNRFVIGKNGDGLVLSEIERGTPKEPKFFDKTPTTIELDFKYEAVVPAPAPKPPAPTNSGSETFTIKQNIGFLSNYSQSPFNIKVESGNLPQPLDLKINDIANISSTNTNLKDVVISVSNTGNYDLLALKWTYVGNDTYSSAGFSDGKLTLPDGGVIAESGGLTGAIKLTPAGGANAYQALVIYPTAALDGDHIHLTAGGGSTELYLGNDTHYVKLVNGGDVAVRASTADLSSTAAWTFDTVGNIDAQQALGIKVPDGVPSSVTAITSTTASWELNPLSNLATTGGSGSGLTVTVTETDGYVNAIAIATAGTGYTAGDVITVTSGTSNATFTIAIAGRNTWRFGTDGRTTFPIGSVPAHSYGAVGDKEGMIVFSDNYIYYCKQDFVGNSVNVTTLASSGLYVYVSSTDYAGDLVADFTANSTGWTYAAVSIISVAVDNTFGPGYALEAATSFGAINGNDYALVSPVTPDIWKRVSWSGDTW